MAENIEQKPELPKAPFVHLHVRSMYSLYDAMGDVDDILKKAKDLGMDAAALTDRAGMYGTIEFYKAAKKLGMKPIIGVEANVAKGRLLEKRARVDDQTYPLILLAETDEGYQNLLMIVSEAFVEGFYYRARTDKVALKEKHTGIIALSGNLKGEIPKLILSHDEEGAERVLREYQDIFGVENFFIEIMHHPESSTQQEANEKLIALARRTGAPLVVTKEVLYIDPDDREAQDALQCIHDGKLLSDQNRYSVSAIDHSMCAPEEILEAFAHVPDAIENTRKIADRCNLNIQLGVNLLPVIDVPSGRTPEEELRVICEEGLIERYGSLTDIAKERLDFELSTIERMGFAAYFLIVYDYVNWAKAHGVVVGPGRGSAAGSIVAYALKITNLDPLHYGLLFERFLNPDRISMPDIDMDFDDVKRKDVIQYVMDKYGHDRVAGIITFGTMAARAAVRDVGRVLGFTFQEVDRVAKVIPPPVQGKHVPLEKSKEESPELRAMYENDARVHQLIDLAIRLEGTTRHASQHACGIIIGSDRLDRFAPMQKAQGGDVERVVQYSLASADAIGLLKMDFLGLSNLTIIRDCLDIIKAVYGKEMNVDNVPLDDKPTYDLLGRAETTGVFQLESDGMKRYIRELKPTRIEDIIAMVALYRPGPMQFIDSFIRRKHGKEKIEYMHPLLESALGDTYGIPVYQEQIMQVSKDMAGFTGGEADTLRKAMGKKNLELMAKMRTKFVSGSMEHGVTSEVAEAIFKQFEEFAAYGFNKSHAACYAMVAYQTAYLKAYYPAAFMAALMNSDISVTDRITIEVEECRRMGMEVLPPDVNESFAGFGVIQNTPDAAPTIRFGLHAIKGLGEDVAEAIVRVRKEGGMYKDIGDFARRIPGRAFNKKSLEALIKSGAMDRFGERNTLLFNIDSLLAFHKQLEREAESGQTSLFASMSMNVLEAPALRPSPPALRREILAWERELLGLYVSEHPFKEYADQLDDYYIKTKSIRDHRKEKSIRCCGILAEVKKIYTKNGDPMLFCRLEDLTGSVEVVVFPRTFKEQEDRYVADKIVCVVGKPQEKDGEMKLLADNCFILSPEDVKSIVASMPKSGVPDEREEEARSEERGAGDNTRVVLHLRTSLPNSILHQLRECCDANPGPHEVFFRVDDERGPRMIQSSNRIAFNDEIAKKLETILGLGTVKVEVG